MTNAFARHGIGHLSASTINLFAAQPAAFVMEKLLKRRGPVGCAAHRGTAAESGIVHGLLNPAAELAECQEIAVQQFDQLTALSGDPKRAKEREALPSIVATGLAELRQYGIPDEVQKRIEVTLPDVPVPFIGFCDLGWTHASIVLDLKTQLRLNSEISAPHARQVALYMRATNWEGRVCYATPNRVGVYRVEDAAQQIATITNIAKRLERFLSISDDPHALAGVVVPDFESFWWSDPTTRAMGREVFGY